MESIDHIKNLISEVSKNLAEAVKSINESNFSDSAKLSYLNILCEKHIATLDTVFKTTFNVLDLVSTQSTLVKLLKNKITWLIWERDTTIYHLMWRRSQLPDAEQADIDAFNRASAPEIPKEKRMNQ